MCLINPRWTTACCFQWKQINLSGQNMQGAEIKRFIDKKKWGEIWPKSILLHLLPLLGNGLPLTTIFGSEWIRQPGCFTIIHHVKNLSHCSICSLVTHYQGKCTKLSKLWSGSISQRLNTQQWNKTNKKRKTKKQQHRNLKNRKMANIKICSLHWNKVMRQTQGWQKITRKTFTFKYNWSNGDLHTLL